MRSESPKIVAVAHRDPNDEIALLQTVSELCGTDRAISIHDSAVWQTLPKANLEWLFLDASVFNSALEDKVRQFKNVVVFYFQANEERVRSLFEAKEGQPAPILTCESHNLTERLLRQKYASQLAAAHRPTLGNISRVKSVAEAQYRPIYSGPVVRSPFLDNFLNSLRASITDNFETLTKGFSSQTTNLRIPQKQLILRQPPSELAEAESSLRAFATDRSSSQRGCFLAGKRGAGKSTLAYYVGRTLTHKKEVCCVAVDYTLALDQALLHRLSSLIQSLRPLLEQGSKEVQKKPLIFKAHNWVNKVMETGDYDTIPTLSPEALTTLELESDRGFITDLYCYHEKQGRSAEQICEDHLAFSSLMNDAEEWYSRMLTTPQRLFALYLAYLVGKHTQETLAVFTYRNLLKYLLITDEFSATATSVARQKLAASSSLAVESVVPFALYSVGRDLPLPKLRRLVLDLIAFVKERAPLLLLFDNVDQRTSTDLEASTILQALKFFDEELVPAFPDARAVISIRDSTLHSQDWDAMSVESTREWRPIMVMPPDLLSVLQKRCFAWMSAGQDIGKAGYRDAMEIVRWVRQMAPAHEKDSIRRRDTLIQIIERRHPFNVREQLKAFAQCCDNVLLHRELSKSLLRAPKDEVPWSDRSYEFFLRVFLLKDARFFSEEYSQIPNIFDNGFPGSPVNACIRSWLIGVSKLDEGASRDQMISTFTSVGVARKEVEAALDTLLRYQLLLLRSEGVLRSLWGDYFSRNIGYDLPYISSVWWTTSMLREYSLGDARELPPTQLREYAGRFVRWFEHEEDLAFECLGASAQFPRFARELGENVTFSLRNIERILS